MAGWSLGPAEVANERAERCQGTLVTSFVINTCLVAAIGGYIYGYDIGVVLQGQSINAAVLPHHSQNLSASPSMEFSFA